MPWLAMEENQNLMSASFPIIALLWVGILATAAVAGVLVARWQYRSQPDFWRNMVRQQEHLLSLYREKQAFWRCMADFMPERGEAFFLYYADEQRFEYKVAAEDWAGVARFRDARRVFWCKVPPVVDIHLNEVVQSTPNIETIEPSY